MARVTISSNNLFPGPRGAQGPAGPEGGPAGPQGPEGPQGNVGPQGPQGIQGPTGPTGAGGAQGLKGDTGNKGDTGDTGPAGTNGTNGTNGAGVVVGGTVGQALTKINSTDYNTQWTTIPLLTTANTFTGGVQQITTASAATVGLIVKATASQSADLQQWQNSSGTVLAKIDNSGNLNGSTSNSVLFRFLQNTSAAGSYVSMNNTNNSVEVIQRITTAVNLIVKGVASQTGDLQQWQNSAGTVNAFVNASGDVKGRLLFAFTTANLSASVNVGTASTGSKGIVVAGQSGQTATLIETQNNVGTVLTSITSAGTINFASGNTSATATAGAVTAPALVVGFITMQVAGTTVKVPYYAN